MLADEPNFYVKMKRGFAWAKTLLSIPLQEARRVQGTSKIILDGVDKIYKYRETALIPLSAKHRIQNIGEDLLVFIEVQTGAFFREDDIVRVDDDYERG